MNTSNHTKKWMSLLTAAMLTLSIGNALAEEPADTAEDTAKEHVDPNNNPAKNVKDRHPVGSAIYAVIDTVVKSLVEDTKRQEKQRDSKEGKESK